MNIFLKKRLNSGISTMLIFFSVFANFSHAFASNDIDSLKQVLITTSDDSVRVFSYLRLNAEYLNSDFKEAENMALLALEISEKSNWQFGVALANIYLGHTYLAMNKFTAALTYYETASEIAEKDNNREALAYSYISLSSIYSDLDLHEKSIEYAQKTLEVLEQGIDGLPEEEYYNRIANVQKSMGRSYFKLKEYDKAETLLLEAANKMKWIRFEPKINCYQILADVYLEQDKIFEARKYLLLSLDYAKKDNLPLLQITLSNDLAKIYTSLQDTDSAIYYARYAINVAVPVGMEEYAVDAFGIISRYFEKKGDFESALYYAKNFKQYNDTISARNKLQETTNAIKKISFEEGYRLQQKESELKRLRNTLLLSILVLILIVFVLLFFLQRTKIKKRKFENKLLVEQKAKLKEDVKSKNLELSSKVMYILRRNKIIEEVIEQLKKIRPSVKKEQYEQLSELIGNLNAAFDDNIWNEFEIKFVNVHVDFYEKLQEDFPDLTINEKRMCAFLRMNLATKEISYFTGMRPNTIDVARTRLRKKFGLTNSGQSLETFLSKY